MFNKANLFVNNFTIVDKRWLYHIFCFYKSLPSKIYKKIIPYALILIYVGGRRPDTSNSLEHDHRANRPNVISRRRIRAIRICFIRQSFTSWYLIGARYPSRFESRLLDWKPRPIPLGYHCNGETNFLGCSTSFFIQIPHMLLFSSR